ncbi:type I-B CRISPR-associated protein Cas8b1/Cst1 [Nitrososphaera viennensis]|uniref:Type I-B CRISPR-associated protein Cas8b1/Cst1 n=2 Tax=Nitrososphaera viennensis TaxID=1034015 RepID=A0A977NLV9_9ARCH|nr:type I-B CRISPR-associated protein Cas8b1/Cst1 [Nitrososphaera viennensis]AIC16847.1 putative CRISPR-associated protein Cas8a1 [Nitrososphaera viennensis EN76]UVS68751.1 type I-B CRISPR-associated protein Cas8b1/Cst1 [Nitrososphaera viennensis]
MRIVAGDWLMNAGIVGYLRMRKLAGKRLPDLSKEYIEITPSDLEGYTDWYFTHVLMRKAEGVFRPGSEVFAGLKQTLDNRQFAELRSKFAKLEKSSLGKIKQDYNDFDSTLQSTIKAAEEFGKKAKDLADTELAKYPALDQKDIAKVEKQLDEAVSKNIKQLRDKSLNFVYIYLNSFYRNKNVIANPASKARKKSFNEEYVKPAIKLVGSSSSSNGGFLCRFCKQNRVAPDKFDDVDSIFAEGMFSTTALTIKFKNFFYNMQPDLFVCDVCELLLISAWAGFTEIPYRFRDTVYNTNNIFVNLPSLELLWKENESVQNLYAREDENLQDTIYQDIIQDVFLSKHEMKARWALSNILFIEIRTTPRKDSGRPDFRYFHIGEDIASLFTEENRYAANALDNIYGRVEIGNGLVVNLKRNVVARILEHDSLFPLCHSLMLEHLNRRDGYSLRNVFNVSLISSIRASIAAGIEREGGGRPLLESKQIYGILKSIQNEGSNFDVIDYDTRKRKSYSMLSMVRNGRIEDFCDTLMKIYMSQNKPVPDSIIGFLNKEDEIGFQARAYAFMSGFLGGRTSQQQQE